MTTVQSISAKAVADSVGINTHIDFNNFGYQDLATTIAAINYLGITHIRDCPGNVVSDLNGPRAWTAMATQCNAMFLPFIGETSPASAQTQLDSYAAFAAEGIIEAVEGPNEWDDNYPISKGTSLPLAAAFQQKVFAVGQTLKLPVINISFGSGWTSANNWAGNYDKVGDLSPYCDFGNAHTYPTLGSSVEGSIKRLDGLAKMAASLRQPIHTEFGFNSSQGFPQADMARFDVFAILDSLLYGSPKLYFYALFDDGSGLFGLMNRDGTPKLSGTAVRNFLAIIKDTAPGKGESLDITLTGTTANDHSLLMQKSDGTFLLALWNERDAAHVVTLALATAAPVVNVHDPVNFQAAIQTFANATQVAVTIPSRPVIVSIGGTPPVVVGVQVPTAITLNPPRLTLPDATADGVTASLISVATSDNLPFTGTLANTGPCALSGSIMTIKGPLTAGPSTMTADVTATGNGVSVTSTLTIDLTPPAPPPLAIQTPTGITLTPTAASLLDTAKPGTLVAIISIGTSDGLPFTGTPTVDAPFKIIGQNVVVDLALVGPATLTPVVRASGGGVDQSATLTVSVAHVVPIPPVVPVLVANPVWGPPALQLAGVGQTISIGGLAINDQWAVGHTGTGNLNIDVVKGTVSLNGTDGKPLAGSGTNRLRLQLNLANANAALMTLTYTAPATVGPDTLTLTYYDQGGKSKLVSIPVTVS